MAASWATIIPLAATMEITLGARAAEWEAKGAIETHTDL